MCSPPKCFTPVCLCQLDPDKRNKMLPHLKDPSNIILLNASIIIMIPPLKMAIKFVRINSHYKEQSFEHFQNIYSQNIWKKLKV